MLARGIIGLAAVGACSFEPNPAGTEAVDGASAIHRDCREALQSGVTASGVVAIDLDGDGPGTPFAAYCDMTTAGGGWTLVWSYGFTNYASFDSGSNAVTPQPTWSPRGDQPASTTIPLAPALAGALDFARWAEIGDDWLVESNINHVVRCSPGSGSLVTLKSGSIDCSVVRPVATECSTNAPNSFGVLQDALGLYGNDTYYYWDGRTQNGNWPTHDPCGDNQMNHVRNVAAPYGAVYLRRR